MAIHNGRFSSDNVRFEVSDGSLTASEEITITVNEVGGPTNSPPSLGPLPNQQVDEGVLLTFLVTATDPDSEDALTLTAQDPPPGATFTDHGNRTGTFTWTPGFDQAGRYKVHFKVSDSQATDTTQVRIRVKDVPGGGGNSPPALDPIGNQAVDAGTLLIFTVTTTDPDAGDVLSLSASTLPPGASFADNGGGIGTFSWTPDGTQVGVYPNVRFEVSDGSLTASEDITITVSDGGDHGHRE